MSTKYETISYSDFKKFHHEIVGQSGYRLGQHFINLFIKAEDNATNYCLLWECLDEGEVDEVVLNLIKNNQWDIDNLVPVRPMLVGGESDV